MILEPCNIMFYLFGFLLTWGLLLLPSYLVLPLGMEMSVLHLAHHCILKVDNLF